MVYVCVCLSVHLFMCLFLFFSAYTNCNHKKIVYKHLTQGDAYTSCDITFHLPLLPSFLRPSLLLPPPQTTHLPPPSILTQFSPSFNSHPSLPPPPAFSCLASSPITPPLTCLARFCRKPFLFFPQNLPAPLSLTPAYLLPRTLHPCPFAFPYPFLLFFLLPFSLLLPSCRLLPYSFLPSSALLPSYLPLPLTQISFTFPHPVAFPYPTLNPPTHLSPTRPLSYPPLVPLPPYLLTFLSNASR